MNERIKELEKLATPRCYDETGCYIGNRFDVEKFAKLIVTECANYITEYHPHSRYEASFMKKHFGVK